MNASDPIPGSASTLRPSLLRKALLLLLRLAFGLGIIFYLAKSGKIDLSSLGRLSHAWTITLAAVGFLFLDILFMSIRASLLFRSARLTLSLPNSIQLNLIGFFFSTFLPGAAGGDIAKLVYATRENHGRRAEVATVLILDRLVGLFSLILLPLLFAPFFAGLLRSAPVLKRILLIDALLGGTMLFGAAVFMFFTPTRSWAASLLARWPGIQNLALRVIDGLVTHGKARTALFYALILSLFANLALMVVTGLGLYTIAPTSFSSRLVLVAPMGHLVNSLPLTPGGIGVGETAFNSLFDLAGMDGGAETLLCVRLWNFLVGLLGLLVYLFGVARVVHPFAEDLEEAESGYIGVGSAD